jgi:ubiquinone/menaquinone biosynthesis C-methylase UbiE
MAAHAASPDFPAITARQQQTWATGDYNVVANTIMPVADALVAEADPRPGQRVLDVACGSGNCAIVAARRHCEVTGVDFVPALLERARLRAAAEETHAVFQEADVQRLPFADDAFDVVLSSFGVMFAPDQERAASEMLRVCRPGGTIALANWTPDGFGGDFFRVVSAYAPPPPAGLKPPARWGTESGLRELLGAGVSRITASPRVVTIFYRSVAHAIDVFRTCFGPTRRAFETNDAQRQQSLRNDLAALFEKYNRASDGVLAMHAGYLQVIATVR